jgi:GT2 family glycosyltransferase
MERFLPPLIGNTSGDFEIIIADNASTDDSVSWLRENYPDLRIIINHTNEGFARGYNTCLAQIDATYYLILNSDVEVTPGWLKPLVKCLDENPQVAAVQPKLLWHTERHKFEYGGAAGGFIDSLGYPFCRGRIFGSLETDQGQHEREIPVFWASGACMLVRSKVFHEAGGFDPLFFAHMEEIDFCWRIHHAGYEIRCVPKSVVYHVGGATLPKNNPGKTYLNFRNNLSMLYKNLPTVKVIPVILARLILDGVAGIRFLFEGHPRDTFAVIRAHFSFYFRIITGRLQRKYPAKAAPIPTQYKGSIVWDHYVLNRKKFSQLPFHPDQFKQP